MSQYMFLVYKSQPQLGSQIFNGVVSVIVNDTTSTLAKQNAALACNAAFDPVALNAAENADDSDDSEADFYQGTDVFPENYFDTAVAISAAGGEPGSGNGSTNGDAYVFAGPNIPPQYVDHSAYTPAT